MFNIEKILVPFDFSNVAQAALSLALQLGEQQEAQLHILYVEQRLDRDLKRRLDTAPGESVIEDTILENEKALLNAVEKERERAQDAGRTLTCSSITPHVVGGSWYQAAMNLVTEQEIDVIVVGTHGRQGLLELVRGTETEEWVRKAPCSVFVVKPQGFPYLRD